MTAQAERHEIGTGRDHAEAEMLRWFFDELLPRWDAAVVGTGNHRTVADLCAAPMFVATCDGVVRARDHAEVAGLLDMHITSLRMAGNDHVLTPDCRGDRLQPCRRGPRCHLVAPCRGRDRGPASRGASRDRPARRRLAGDHRAHHPDGSDLARPDLDTRPGARDRLTPGISRAAATRRPASDGRRLE